MDNIEDAEIAPMPETDWQAKAQQLEADNNLLIEQIRELSLTVQIANDRWIKQVNENTQLELQLRKQLAA